MEDFYVMKVDEEIKIFQGITLEEMMKKASGKPFIRWWEDSFFDRFGKVYNSLWELEKAGIDTFDLVDTTGQRILGVYWGSYSISIEFPTMDSFLIHIRGSVKKETNNGKITEKMVSNNYKKHIIQELKRIIKCAQELINYLEKYK